MDCPPTLYHGVDPACQYLQYDTDQAITLSSCLGTLCSASTHLSGSGYVYRRLALSVSVTHKELSTYSTLKEAPFYEP